MFPAALWCGLIRTVISRHIIRYKSSNEDHEIPNTRILKDEGFAIQSSNFGDSFYL